MEMDYSSVRAHEICPLCQGAKENGLLVCWPCYRAHDLRYAHQAVEKVIGQAEETLAGEQRKTSQVCPD